MAGGSSGGVKREAGPHRRALRMWLRGAGAVFLLAALAFAALAVYALLSGGAPPRAPEQRSTPGTVSVASDGCCLDIRRVSVRLISGERAIAVLEQDVVAQDNQFDARVPELLGSSPVSARISFDYSNIRTGRITLDAMAFGSADALRANGLMLYFTEGRGMSLLAVSGDRRAWFDLTAAGWMRLPQGSAPDGIA